MGYQVSIELIYRKKYGLFCIFWKIFFIEI